MIDERDGRVDDVKDADRFVVLQEYRVRSRRQILLSYFRIRGRSMESLTQECGFRIYYEIYSWELLSTLTSRQTTASGVFVESLCCRYARRE